MAGLFVWSTATFDKMFAKATSHLLLEPDWESILQICDCIRERDVQPKYVLSCIKKKLYVQNPHVVLYTLQVLESCMKNCGSPFHVEVASRPFMEELKELVKTTTNGNVRSRILELIQIWAHTFRNEPKYLAVQDIFNMLKMEGYKLQILKESDAMFIADSAPDWADGNCCHRCRAQFTVVHRKHHCRNCGQVFCSKCSSRSCPIPRFSIEEEVRVCEACWEKLNNTPMCSKNKNNHEQGSNVSPEIENKKAVKFKKKKFPVYKKERPNENELFHNRSKSCNFPTETPLSRELWSSDCEGNYKTTSNSDDSLPPVNDAGIPEQRMPRFCYNCGTKYPVVSAKFCCECGARKFILGVNNGQLYAV